jgi:two-component system sensor histidine kinase GlrK
MIAQSVLIGLVLLLALYALNGLYWLTAQHHSILTIDATCLVEEKQLLKVFLAQMRNAEKYLLLKDAVFHTTFLQGKSDFLEGLAKVHVLADTPRERVLEEEIKNLHTSYERQLSLPAQGEGDWQQLRTDISNNIIERINELIRIREGIVAEKMSEARDLSLSTATLMGWLTFAGIGGVLLFAFFHARSLSMPLKRLTKEMHRVGRGEFSRSIAIGGPREVSELAHSFNWMAEKLASLDRLKADFTAHVSHELRTPLTAIREGTELLLEGIPGPVSPPQREILQVVHDHSERLFQNISSLLDLSRMEAQMMEYELTACDLRALILQTLAVARMSARKKEIDLKAELAEPIPLLSVDERRIGQVLENLISNSIKFTPVGGEIRVSATLNPGISGRGSQVEVRVADNGAGIPKEEAEKIFERFYQGSHNRGSFRQGVGLGLSIVRHIVEAHKGRVWVESEVETGVVFTFSLPVNPGDHADPAPPLPV